MNKKFFLILVSVILIQPIASAVITTEEQFSEKYIINHGYSTETARLMNLQHNQIMGKETPVSESKHIYRPWQNGIRTFLMYLDPALDDEKFMQHDAKYTSRWDSL